MREHEAHARQTGQVELGHDRREVVAVRAQTMHPDHSGGGTRRGFDFEGFE
jgi:hypothetical protein